MRLTNELIHEIWEDILADFGYCSCQMVADALADLEVKTWRKTAPTRQAIHYHLRKTEQGRKWLNQLDFKSFPKAHFTPKKWRKEKDVSEITPNPQTES